MGATFSEALRSKLVDQQQRDGLSDGGMGARLLLRQSQWTRVRNGNCGLGSKAIDGAVAAFPELVVEVFAQVSGRPIGPAGEVTEAGAVEVGAPA